MGTINSEYQNNFVMNESLYLFAFNEDGEPSFDSEGTRIYSMKIWDYNTLVRDFIPIYNKITNSAGLYDTVKKKFYRNRGIGNFIEGPEKTND